MQTFVLSILEPNSGNPAQTHVKSVGSFGPKSLWAITGASCWVARTAPWLFDLSVQNLNSGFSVMSEEEFWLARMGSCPCLPPLSLWTQVSCDLTVCHLGKS